MTDKKKFGLLIPRKVESLKFKRSSIFDEDSDEDETSHKRPKIPQKKMESKSKIKTESLEDPSIYEYDSVWDEMKLKQTESIAPKEKKNSRYIDTLLKAADKRKKEYERRLDRKIQVEREKEGDKFKDKEAFVTSAYKKKMEEQEAEEERERRENMLNEMMDVTKQKDLSGFYRHFLKQTVGEEKVPEFGEKQIKKEILSDEEESFHHKQGKSSKSHTNINRDEDGSSRKSGKSPKDYKSNEIASSSQRHCKRSTDFKRGQGGEDVEIDSDNNCSSSHKFRKRSKDIHLAKDSAETDSDDNTFHKSKKSLKSTKQNRKEGNVSYKHQDLSTKYGNIDKDSDGIQIDSDDDDGNNSSHKHSKITKTSHKSISEDNKEDSYSQRRRKSSEDTKNLDQDRSGVEIDSDNDSDKNCQRELSSKRVSRNSDRKYLLQKSSDKENQRSKSIELSCDIKSKNSQSQKHIRGSNRKACQSSDSSDDEKECSPTKQKHSNPHKKYKKKKNDSKLSGRDSDSSLSDEDDKKQNEKIVDGSGDQCPSEKIPKKNIYEKRTVGDIFAEAQARYFQRIAARNAGI